MTRECAVYQLGMADYRTAWNLQARLSDAIAAGEHPPALLLLEHPHTYTFGRRGKIENLLWGTAELQQHGVEVHWVDRGGDVTYHGPGQLVGYPLLPLAPVRIHLSAENPGTMNVGETSGNSEVSPEAEMRLPRADYVGYLRRLEQSIILALLDLGLVAGQIDGLTGVWVQPDVLSRCRDCAPDLRQPPAKIAALGVKVDARGVTRHGFALNIDPDMSYWEGIVACGLAGYPSTSLAELLRPLPSRERVTAAVTAAFGKLFDYQMIERNLELLPMEREDGTK